MEASQAAAKTSGLEKIPRFLRPNERKIMEKNAEDLERAANSPYLLDQHEKKLLRDAAVRTREDIARQSPPPLSRIDEDRAAKRVKQLEEQISKEMLSDEEMRRNPVGAVDHHIRWERGNKAAIKEWKALQIALHPGMGGADKDLCNVERLRRRTNPNRNYDDAQIPRSTLYSMPPDTQQLGDKAGWPYIVRDSDERIMEEKDTQIQDLLRKVQELEASGGQVQEVDVSQVPKKDLSQVERQKPFQKR